MTRIGLIMVALVVSVLTAPSPAVAKSTMETVRDRGYVLCGVTDRTPGFSDQDINGEWSGFNIDFCRALAVAVLKNGDAFKAQDMWLDALAAKDIDVLHAGSTWTFGRDTNSHVEFPGIYFYDGQSFIAHTTNGVHTLKDALAQPALRVCAVGATSVALRNLKDYVARMKVGWTIVPILTLDGMWRAFFGGRCDMALHDRAALAAILADRLDGSSDFVVFSEVISKEPLAPAVREDDPRWRDLVSWVTLATIAAEELGISRENVDEMRTSSTDPEVRRLLGAEEGLGRGLGLDDDWAYRVIKTVGNYGEIFERNLGAKSRFKMQRGMNDLWRNGGLLYAPPIR